MSTEVIVSSQEIERKEEMGHFLHPLNSTLHHQFFLVLLYTYHFTDQTRKEVTVTLSFSKLLLKDNIVATMYSVSSYP